MNENFRKQTQDRIKLKVDKYQQQGYADKEYVKEIKNKKIKMFLPNNVFEQQKFLNLAEMVLHGNLDFYENLELEKVYFESIAKNTLVDGKELTNMLGMADFELPQMQSLAILYYMELLAPLSRWRYIVVKEMLF